MSAGIYPPTSLDSFADALMDLLVRDVADQTTTDLIRYNVSLLPASMSTLRGSLQALLKSAGGDICLFRASLEDWYDDHMDRVSGWYKRHVAKITFIVGGILVLLLNINMFTIGRALYNDSIIRATTNAVTLKGAVCRADVTVQVPRRSTGPGGSRRPVGLAGRLGRRPRLRSTERAMQLAGPAGDLQPPWQFGRAGHACCSRLPAHFRVARPWRPPLVRSLQQDRTASQAKETCPMPCGAGCSCRACRSVRPTTSPDGGAGAGRPYLVRVAIGPRADATPALNLASLPVQDLTPTSSRGW